MKTIHIQLPDERRNVRVFEILAVAQLVSFYGLRRFKTYARTLEKSCEGDITKLSAELDQLIRCCMFGSSNMLRFC